MAFRADEAARTGFEEVTNYFISRTLRNAVLDEAEIARSRETLQRVHDECGPVVDNYPSWHPLVRNQVEPRAPATTPGVGCGYNGLDHTRFFANGFITCPYRDGSDVLASVDALPAHPAFSITAEKLDVHLYNRDATPILVKCEWHRPLHADGTIPPALAVPLLLEQELPCWTWAQLAETWESMRPYFLGRPHGSRSSLFVNQETGQAIRKIWEALISTGMFGPI